MKKDLGEVDDEKADELLDEYESLLYKGEFEEVDRRLTLLDPSSVSTVGILVVLTITYWGKDKLTARDGFLARAEPVMKSRLGEERGENLLKNRR